MNNTISSPKVNYLKDYTAPCFQVDSLDLEFVLHETTTQVTATMQITLKNTASNFKSVIPLIFDGEDLELIQITLNDKALMPEQFKVTENSLTIYDVAAFYGQSFKIQTVVRINPLANTQLSGLYLTNGIFCTQCEAEGFRRITYYLDRPDILTKFTTKIIADKAKFPVLLSNGNLIDHGSFNSQHYALWQDPFLKPCYLFALVAGKLDHIEDFFITRSERRVTLQIYVEPGNKEKATYAMQALKEAMRWDEKVFNREYDLDIFMIVAVSDFNMGAMENKGLNIFNSKYILASPETATDEDYEAIAAVIAHEYFHNWSGNRVTCRDWFQLSLKEGFTIFRDQEYTSDTTSRAVKRIKDVRNLRTFQFPEDAGPMSHPVQPDSYVEIDNFYTHTVYEKGAEVIRMIKLIIGDDAFYHAVNLYFSTNDGNAVTIEEFVSAMEQVSKKDLHQFRLWYKQAGTPKISVKLEMDHPNALLRLYVEQNIPDTAGQSNKLPMHIPLAIGFYDASSGKKIETKETQFLELTQKKHIFEFKNFNQKPILSLLNDFSAPVEIDYCYSQDELCFLMKNDTNPFSKWEAGQTYIRNYILDEKEYVQIESFFVALVECLLNPSLDDSFKAELLTLPSEKYLLNLQAPVDISSAHLKFKNLEIRYAVDLNETLYTLYKRLSSSQPVNTKTAGTRKLKNACLYYLSKLMTEESTKLLHQQYINSTNMTDLIASFKAIISYDNVYRTHCIEDFYQRFQHDTLVLDKWLSAQAIIDDKNALDRVENLMKHSIFTLKNPNKVRALIGAFTMYNHGQFHRIDGKGYELLANVVIDLNKINPQIAARLLEPLIQWRKFTNPNQTLMHSQLIRIHAEPNLSADVFEILEKSL